MSIQEAAGAIVALINSKAASPTQADIEAVLARTWPNAEVPAASARTADERPRMPPLTDKDIDDLYAFKDDIEIGVQCLSGKLADLFHDYQLAAFDWDHARGLLSEQDLDGVDPEADRRREEARARSRMATAERLIEAVLQWHGLDPTKVIGLPGRTGA